MQNILDKFLHYIGKNKTPTFLVQVGTMDGESHDVISYSNMYDWDGLYVEPVSHYFNKLVRAKKLTDKFEQSAVVETDGLIEVVTIDRTAIKADELHHELSEISVIWPTRNGFTHEYDRPILEKYGKRILVNGITLNTLFKKHDIRNFDIFLCDAEGLDYVVFKQLDLNIYRPKLIRLEWINLTKEEQSNIIQKLTNYNYVYEINNQNIDAVVKELYDVYVLEHPEELTQQVMQELTVVTGLWDIKRTGRDFDHYIENFKKFLQIPVNLFLYVPKELEYLVWERRSNVNTFVRTFELDDIKNNLYSPFWENTQKIRNDESWKNKTGEAGWLKNSPQASNEWYNPIVQSKMFMLNDAQIMNPFNSDYFIWLDAAITHTVYEKYFTENRCLDKIIPHLNTFLFLSYPYETLTEIHGFDYQAMKKYTNQDVKYVCRGGLFGGHKNFIAEANATYYHLLNNSLSDGHMGTEESIFSIMAHLEPHIYKRYELDENGLIVKFVQALLDGTVELKGLSKPKYNMPKGVYNKNIDKTSLYVLSFNFPEQFRALIHSMQQVPEWLDKPRKILINNSNKEDIIQKYDEICKEFGFEHIITGENLGINRGRLYAAKHFHQSDSKYYFFFEDDMMLHPPGTNAWCRNGFRQYVPGLYEKVHHIMAKEQFDFLKLSYTEVYMDNNIQVSWYNVPQSVRTELWPEYDRLPVSGLDPYAPRTKFDKIDCLASLSYVTGDIYYANWPMIVSKEGNYKMFLETEWANPFEQTWMSHMFQETLKGNIKPAVLLASPINHNRISHYSQDIRREN